MTRRLLQGIAIGIILATLPFAYYYYMVDQTEEASDEKKDEITEEEIAQYLQLNELVMISEQQYEELVAKAELAEQFAETNEQAENVTQGNDEEITIIIEPGMNSRSVALLLEEKGIIRERKAFEDYLISHGLVRKIQAGEYKLTIDMPIMEIVEKIT